MKKSKFVVIILSILIAEFLFSSMSINRAVSIKGYINYYGNVPVETPAFKTDDGKIYLMQGENSSKITLDEILSHQGEYLELTGEIEVEESKTAFPISSDGTISISSFRVIK